jgi:transcriptional regulator GlxA family with amidase domain
VLDAAEALRDGTPVVWADVAAELGYADQAHLVRDFRAATARPLAAYAREVGPSG